MLALLDEHILPEADRTVGRPGMDLWQILVLGVLKQGLGCDFDRLHDLTNHHQTIRAFLGHGDFDDKTRYEYQTVVDNVSLLTPELLPPRSQRRTYGRAWVLRHRGALHPLTVAEMSVWPSTAGTVSALQTPCSFDAQ